MSHHGRDQQLVGQADEYDHNRQAEVRGQLRGNVEANHTGAEKDLQDSDRQSVQGEVASGEQDESAEEAKINNKHESQEANELLAHLLEARQKTAVIGA